MSGSVLVVFGTHPEAIKLAPVVTALRARPVLVRVCVTAQRRQILGHVLPIFGTAPMKISTSCRRTRTCSIIALKARGGKRCTRGALAFTCGARCTSVCEPAVMGVASGCSGEF
jgi:UDP-N-acetylglucosamine 2-epimerase (non-hydrolysing)